MKDLPRKQRCVACGRDVSYKKVHAQYAKTARDVRKICLSCGPEGWRFDGAGSVLPPRRAAFDA